MSGEKLPVSRRDQFVVLAGVGPVLDQFWWVLKGSDRSPALGAVV